MLSLQPRTPTNHRLRLQKINQRRQKIKGWPGRRPVICSARASLWEPSDGVVDWRVAPAAERDSCWNVARAGQRVPADVASVSALVPLPGPQGRRPSSLLIAPGHGQRAGCFSRLLGPISPRGVLTKIFVRVGSIETAELFYTLLSIPLNFN